MHSRIRRRESVEGRAPSGVCAPTAAAATDADSDQAAPQPGTPRLTDTFGALRSRNFQLWFAGRAISLAGMWMQSVAQGWVVYELTSSQFALGAISFARSIPAVLLILPAGVLADRVSRRSLLLITKGAMMACAAILAVLAGAGVLETWHIAIVALALGTAMSFDAPARQSVTVEMVEHRRDLPAAIALNSTVFNLARIVGPSIGGIVLATAGAAWCFGLNAVGYLTAIVTLLLMRLPQRSAEQAEESLRSQLAVGLRYVARSVPIRTMMVLVAITSLLGFPYMTLLPVFAADVLRAGETGLGALNTGVGIGAVAGSLLVASQGRSRRKGLILSAGSLLFPGAILVFAVSRSLSLSIAALVVVGFGYITEYSTCNTMIQALVPDELRGRVMSVYMLMIYGAMPLGSLLAGSVAEVLGPTPALFLTAGPCLAFAIAVLLFVPSLRRLGV
jgi:MFS family permease